MKKCIGLNGIANNKDESIALRLGKESIALRLGKEKLSFQMLYSVWSIF